MKISIEVPGKYEGNVIVKSGRSANVVPEKDLQEWGNDISSMVNGFIEFRKHGGTGVSMNDGKLQITGDPEALMKMMAARAKEEENKHMEEVKEETEEFVREKRQKAAMEEVDDLREKLAEESEASKKIKAALKAEALEKKRKAALAESKKK